MEAERWERIAELFQGALDLDAAERDALLARECAGDDELRGRIERLLRDDEAGGDLFDSLETRAPASDPMLGRTVGAYRLVEQLAVGGMGVVYRGERTDGLFDHEVAVKLIRSERATEGMVQRFELERRTLAALRHPCIARLHDGGTARDGRPYLVMELVRGVPIDRYCDRERLSVAARVRLFAEVCRAVHFAHQSLVVHRDLKPANILIDEHGTPKLVDFGIARLLQEDERAPPPDATRTLARVLTPEYASPEQLAGGPVTTALDVYALGAVLYEILTGRKPFGCESRSLADWERVVCERPPPRPSTVVGLAAQGDVGAAAPETPDARAQRLGSTPRELERRLRGDLDRIVLMALRKEPERRYGSAQALAEDLERHLAGQPVLARGDSLGYRASKFVRRNRLAVASALAVGAALCVGLVAAWRSEGRARAMAESARIEASSFQGVAEFLGETFLTATVSQDPTRLQLARARVLAHAERVRRQYSDGDPIRANLLDALGQVCVRLDLFEDAQLLIEEALALRERAYGARSLERAQSLRSLGLLDHRRGDFARAALSLREALELHRTCPIGPHTDVASLANDLAACLRHTGDDDEALQMYREALALRRAAGERSLPVAESLNNLAGLHLDRGDFEQAAGELAEARAIRAAILGAGHRLALQTAANLASALWPLGRREEARALLLEAEAGFRALQADGEEGLGGVLSSLGWIELADGNLDPAERRLEEALELQTRRLGADHPAVAELLGKLAVVFHARGQDADARALWEEVLARHRSSPSSARELATSAYSYAVLLYDLRSYEEALPLLEESLSAFAALPAADPLAVGLAEALLARCFARTGRSAETAEHLGKALSLLVESGRAPPGELERVRQELSALAADARGEQHGGTPVAPPSTALGPGTDRP